LKGHQRAFIHARHEARVERQALWREYRLEVSDWRRQLLAREELLLKLLRLEKRLARSHA
jgi:hypothetical protein